MYLAVFYYLQEYIFASTAMLTQEHFSLCYKIIEARDVSSILLHF